MSNKSLKKHPKDSEVIMTEIVFPNDTNPYGILQGGKLVQWMDVAAAVTAQLHAETTCVTILVDSIKFTTSAKSGDIILIKSKITRVFTTSLEIKVKAFIKGVKTKKDNLITTSYFTFVAIDKKNKKKIIKAIYPETEEEINEYNTALVRKQNREKKNE